MKHIAARHILTVATALAILGGAVAYALANTYTNQEVESVTRTGNVGIVADTSASGSSAVKFGSSGSLCPAAKRVITATDVTNLKNSGYPAGTQVYVPDGPDPWGGCFPGPLSTGIPAGGYGCTSFTPTSLAKV